MEASSRNDQVVIIGGGQAGLAMSRCLADRAIEHVVLERGRVAERWRSASWDSLHLLSPNWQTRLPGWRYRGPDPDGFPAKSLWPATVHAAPGAEADGPPAASDPAAALVLVERSLPEPMPFDQIQAIEDRGASCLQLHRVRFIRSYFSLDRKRMLCLYEAPDAEAVRIANRQTGLPFEVAWTTDVLMPASPPLARAR